MNSKDMSELPDEWIFEEEQENKVESQIQEKKKKRRTKKQKVDLVNTLHLHELKEELKKGLKEERKDEESQEVKHEIMQEEQEEQEEQKAREKQINWTAAVESEPCMICLSPFTSKVRKPVYCAFCHYCACVTCVKKYLLSIQSDPRCMNCNIAWSMEFLDDTFSRSWRKGDYNKHRQKVLMDREISMLPHEMKSLEQTIETENLEKQIKQVHQDKLALRHKLRDLQLQIRVLKTTNPSLLDEKSNGAFIRACPVNNCRGFLSKWKCALCNAYICAQCHAIKKARNDEDHVCKEDDLQTATLINKETKPCPGCGTPIMKISGCEQMFCISCHTPFSWKTGQVIKHALHNPHFYDFLRLHPEEAKRWNPEQKVRERFSKNPVEEGSCESQLHITLSERERLLEFGFGFKQLTPVLIDNIVQLCNHLGDNAVRQQTRNSNLFEEKKRKYRILYLQNKVDKVKWKRLLSLSEQRYERLKSVTDIYLIFAHEISRIAKQLCKSIQAFRLEVAYENNVRSLGALVVDENNDSLHENTQTQKTQEEINKLENELVSIPNLFNEMSIKNKQRFKSVGWEIITDKFVINYQREERKSRLQPEKRKRVTPVQITPLV